MSINVHKRVLKDIKDGMVNLKKEFGALIGPEEKSFYRVHFILPGPEDTPFEGGLYHGMIRLNDNHPHSAPNIHMITPNGRFIPEPYPISATSRGICTTATAFHPETWTPMNNIESVIKGFISLMCDPFDGGVGGMSSTADQMKKYAKESINHIKADPIVIALFPDLHNSLVDGTYKPIKMGDLSKKKSITNAKSQVAVEPKPVQKNLPDSDIEFASDNEVVGKSRKKIKSTKKKIIVTDSDNSSDSDSDSSTETKPKARKPISKSKSGKKITDDSDSEEEMKTKKKKPAKKKPTKTSESDSDSESSEVKTKKKPVKNTKSSSKKKNANNASTEEDSPVPIAKQKLKKKPASKTK